MFREMRRKDKQLQHQEAISILEECNYGVLSVTGENGYPYGVPMNYIYYKDSLYLHCAEDGYKLDNISQNNKVSFCVVGDSKVISEKFTTNYKSVIVFGKIEKADVDEKKEVLVEFISKFAKSYMTKGKKYVSKSYGDTTVLRIEIEYLTGKGNK
ncbi:pyridoxamine 5'-phosphate oxidase family protein [Clostridium sp. D2Q-11]|uniref:Pyridoxamine 5'-phosphate oxidase family protein n=1 Tax=Anaeromonas frigoriresistens TaxID=2683708 RepID=A0A942Z626_9FIRM|nr:pyridoxamine 5'-phosphate oxidase family protein [Anaeromonas frigoriresistens]MBS4537127.1 pyridoxamine 5'-phosphate oxidase family protein [Anaeromonas frigoriresistens]